MLLFTNFILLDFINPSTNDFKWPMFEVKEPVQYVHINPKIEIRESIWDDLKITWRNEHERLSKKLGKKVKRLFDEL
jgi:hypothetical protein